MRFAPPEDNSEVGVGAKMFNAEPLLAGMAQLMTVLAQREVRLPVREAPAGATRCRQGAVEPAGLGRGCSHRRAAREDAGAEPACYVGSARSEKFHRPDCRSASEIGPGNLVCFETREEAVTAGYVPCRVRKP